MVATPPRSAQQRAKPKRSFSGLGALACIGLVLAGCEPKASPDLGPALEREEEEIATHEENSDQVRQRLDRVLQATFERRLNMADHAAWQVLHGVLAYGHNFRAATEAEGPMVPVLDHLLSGNPLQGWTTTTGTLLDETTGRRGLRTVLEGGSKTGQGHHDQWFAVLAQAGLSPQTTILCGGREYTMEDWVAQVKFDVTRNLEQEFSWTVIGLTTYLPTDASWIADGGESWSIERMVESELAHDLAASPCGGSHRLIGVTMALNQHLAQEGELAGVWEQADQRVQQALRTAEEFQHASGAFSIHYFQRPGVSPDLAEDLGSTGHTLEFITLAASDQQLRAAWVRRAAMHLCDLLEQTANLPLECGALYHAAHGLMLYRQRLFGEFVPEF